MRDCIPGSHGTVPITEMVLGRLPPPEHCPGSALKHTPSPSEDVSLLVLELWSEGWLQAWLTFSGCVAAFREGRLSAVVASWHLPSASLHLTSITQKSS